MYEREYLDDADVRAFTGFLRELIVAGHAGITIRVGTGRSRRPVNTLHDAIAAYSWRGENFDAINAKVECMRTEVHTALCRCADADGKSDRRLAELELLFASTKALSLGQVYEGAFPFLIHQAETGVLSENLRLAATIIDGAVEEVDAFDDRPFRSDCAMSKVYAVMNQRTVVYDERLGAALGLLCRYHLEREQRTAVPECLAFMVGDHRDPRRNPSDARFRFHDKHAGREHARWNIRANWIVSRVAADAAVTAVLGGCQRERIRAIEAGLFVIGDDVRDQPRLKPGPLARTPPTVTLAAVNGVKRSS